MPFKSGCVRTPYSTIRRRPRTTTGTTVNRRTFLSGALAQPIRAAQTVSSMPIIDTHIHLFDTTRPQGVPWPSKDNAILYKPALPRRYREIAVPLGVRGAIEVE